MTRQTIKENTPKMERAVVHKNQMSNETNEWDETISWVNNMEWLKGIYVK